MGLISYFQNLYYNNRLKKAARLLNEGKTREGEELYLYLVDKQPLAAGELAEYYYSLSSSSDVKTDIELFRKTILLRQKGTGIYDAKLYDSVLSKYINHIRDKAIISFDSNRYEDCYSLSSILVETNLYSLDDKVLCSESRIRLLYNDIETTKASSSGLNSLIETFKQEWSVCGKKQRANDSALRFCQSLTDAKRYYVANLLLSVIYNDNHHSKCLDNAELIALGKDNEIPTQVLKSVVSSYAKEIILRKESTKEKSLSLFDACWKASNNVPIMIDVLKSVSDSSLKEAFIDRILKEHRSYLSSKDFFKHFSEWLFNDFDGLKALNYLENIQGLGYDVEELYTKKVHTWTSKMSCEERLTHLNHAQILYPKSSIIVEDKEACAQLFLDKRENDKAIAVADSILSTSKKAKIIKAHALCNLASKEKDIDEKIDILKKAQSTLASCSGSEKDVIMKGIIDAFIITAKQYYQKGDIDKSYTILTELSNKGIENAAFAIAELRLQEVQSVKLTEEKLSKVNEAIGELCKYGIPSIVNDGNYQKLWREKIDAILTSNELIDNSTAVTNFEALIHDIDHAGFEESVKKDYNAIVIKQIIKRKYLIARDFEKGNKLAEASRLYKEINLLEAKHVPTLSALRYALCKLKTIKNSEVLEHKDRIYTLLKKAAAAYTSEKKDIAYRFAFLLLKSGEDQEALSVLSEFLPEEDYLKKACEQGTMLKALAKLEDFNEKLDAVQNRTLSSDDAVYFINHMLEYAETIKPVLDIPRSTLGKYRNKLKNYAIFKLFDEERFNVAFEKMLKEHRDYLDDYTALRNIALVCLNMAEAGQITSANFKDVISIWLTSIYQEQLFIKSLDYTSWDDQFTFSLYDSYGHFNDDTLGTLPDNVNNYYSDDDNVVQIKEVQRSLLDRFEAAISGNQQFHEFYTSQKDEMDAFIALNLDIKCRIVAPYLANKDEEVFQRIYDALEQDRKQEYDNWEDVLSVGACYQMPLSIYNDYSNAKSYYEECVETIDSFNLNKVGQVFTLQKIKLIKQFNKLASALISYCNSKVSSLSANNKSEFKNNFKFYSDVCYSIKDSTLSFVFSNYVMQFVVSGVNDKSMKKSEAADYILSIFILDNSNSRVKENLNTLFEMLAREESTDSNRAVKMILEKVKAVDTNFYNRLYDENERAKIDKALNDIVKQLTSKSMSESTALQKVYSLYKTNNSHDAICEILAQLCTACIMKYVIKQESGGYAVTTVLDSLASNMSPTFRQHRSHFKQAHDSVWNSLPSDAKLTLRGLNPRATLNSSGLALKKGLDYYKSLGGFTTPSSSISDILGLF